MKETPLKSLDLEPKEEHSAEIIPFQTKPKEPDGPDWLSELPEGTTFLTRNKGQAMKEVNLWQHTILNAKPERARLILTVANSLNQVEEWVVPVMFCKAKELVEVIKQNVKE